MKPILFNTEMVRAILDGRKTVTRRVIKPPALYAIATDSKGNCGGSYYEDEHGGYVYPTVDDCPYQPGDVLYVRETWSEYDGEYIYKTHCWYKKVLEEVQNVKLSWRPSIHMPKVAARIFLRVKDVRVERLQDITEAGARVEGAVPFALSADPAGTPDRERTWHELGEARWDFIRLWDSTIKKSDLPLYGWQANPWVWVIEFERISKEEAER